jgi:hypothetical protein
MAGFLVLLALVVWHGGGLVGGVALVVAFTASITQTVLFEPTWWLAAGLFLPEEGARLTPVHRGPAADHEHCGDRHPRRAANRLRRRGRPS